MLLYLTSGLNVNISLTSSLLRISHISSLEEKTLKTREVSYLLERSASMTIERLLTPGFYSWILLGSLLIHAYIYNS